MLDSYGLCSHHLKKNDDFLLLLNSQNSFLDQLAHLLPWTGFESVGWDSVPLPVCNCIDVIQCALWCNHRAWIFLITLKVEYPYVTWGLICDSQSSACGSFQQGLKNSGSSCPRTMPSSPPREQICGHSSQSHTSKLICFAGEFSPSLWINAVSGPLSSAPATLSTLGCLVQPVLLLPN